MTEQTVPVEYEFIQTAKEKGEQIKIKEHPWKATVDVGPILIDGEWSFFSEYGKWHKCSDAIKIPPTDADRIAALTADNQRLTSALAAIGAALREKAQPLKLAQSLSANTELACDCPVNHEVLFALLADIQALAILEGERGDGSD